MLSNILPHSISSFDTTRKLLFVAILFHLKLPLSWSTAVRPFKFLLPLLLYHFYVILYSVQLLQKRILLMRVTDSDQPLFQVQSSAGPRVLIDSIDRKYLRRGSATWAYFSGSHPPDSSAEHLEFLLCLEVYQPPPFSPPFFLARAIQAHLSL